MICPFPALTSFPFLVCSYSSSFYLISFTQKSVQAVMKPGFILPNWNGTFIKSSKLKRLASTNYQLHSYLSWFQWFLQLRHKIRCLNSSLGILCSACSSSTDWRQILKIFYFPWTHLKEIARFSVGAGYCSHVNNFWKKLVKKADFGANVILLELRLPLPRSDYCPVWQNISSTLKSNKDIFPVSERLISVKT